jgi:vitamin B12 transporter
VSLAFIALAAAAATTSDIIVTARLPDPSLERSYAARVLTQADLTTTPAGRLDDALQIEPGFQTFRRTASRTANPTTQGVTLRALGGNAASRVTVTLDGVPQEDPFAGWIPFSAISTRDLASVRLVRGGGSVIAGPGALAGSLSLTSLTPISSGGDFITSIGSFGTSTIDTRLNLVGERWYASISGSAFDSAGYPLIVASQRGPADVPAASHARTVRLRTGFALSDTASVTANLGYFDENKLGGFAIAPNSNSGTEASLRYVKEDGQAAWSVNAVAWWKQRDFRAAAAAATSDRTRATPTLDQFNVPGDGWGGRLEVRSPAVGAVTARLGAEVRFAAGETNELFRYVSGSFTRLRKAGGNSRIIGGFAEVAWALSSDILLSAGARADIWQLTNGRRTELDRASGTIILAQNFANRRQSLGTARAALLWNVTPAVTVRSAGYLGWRPPTLNELYRPFRVGNDVTEANADLRPERLAGLDIGVDYAPLESSKIELTLFANRVHNAIANITLANGPGTFPSAGFIPLGGSYRQRRNLADINSLGIEARATTRLPYGLKTDIGYSYTRARIITVASENAAINIALQNKNLAQSPQHQATFRLAWEDKSDRFGLSLFAKYTSAAFEDDLNTRTLAAYVTFDMSARWRIAQRAEIIFNLENATNTEIQSAITADAIISRAQPRSLSVTFKTQF